MFSYDELVEYKKRYFFKLDKNTSERKLFDKDASDFVSNSSNYDKILAALEIMDTLGETECEFGGFIKAPYKTPEERIAWEKEQVVLLQESLYKTLSNGSFKFHENVSEMGKAGFIDRTFFQKLAHQEKYPDLAIKKVNCLMNYLLDSHGKKLISYDMQKRVEGNFNVIYDFTFNTREKTFSEQLKPNSPQYTQQSKPKTLSPEAQAKRRAFVEELLSYYKMMESDMAYSDRVEKEDANMKLVADTVNNSKTISGVTSGRGLMNKLMAAQNLSLNGEKDYLEYLISQPEISDLLLEIKKSDRFEQIKQQAELNKSNGKVSNGRVKGHLETLGERCTRLANNAISRNPSTVSNIKRYLSSAPTTTFSKNDEATAYIFSAVARTMGNTPSISKNNDGDLTFDSGTDITR